jgi:hypothetical protein
MDNKTENLRARDQHRINRNFGPLLAHVRALFTASWGGLVPEVHLFCDSCGKHISSKADWICGYCDYDTRKNNSNTAYYSFLHKCVSCSTSAKAYLCPYCEAVNYLDTDKNTQHPARVISDIDSKPKVQIDPSEQKRREHLEQKEQLEREIEIAALNKRLVQLRASPEFKQEVSEQEKIQKGFSEFESKVLGVKMLERNERLKNSEVFKDDPEMLEMKNLALDAFVEEHGLTPTRFTKQENRTA